jgi:2-polyprenyl-3-methyl-5-hydroxy-6-metoxy-1,4-benzoquinol methylase
MKGPQVKRVAKALIRARFLAGSADTPHLATYCSVAELVARHKGGGGYERLDLLVALLAIRESEGADSGGIALFEKLLAADLRVRAADRALLSTLKAGPFSSAVYLCDRVPITQGMTLSSTVAGLAIALHRGMTKLAVSITVSRARLRYDEDWFRAHGFAEAEVAQLSAAADELYHELGILPLPWSRLQHIESQMRALLPRDVTLHGRGDFYQSLEPLLIQGQRPTAQRFAAYGLSSLLRSTQRVLDVGSNCGFVALTAAKHVAEVDGIDEAGHFVAIANIAQGVLRQENCRFQQCRFEDFTPVAPYDVVFAFAVHHWLGLSMREYAARLHTLLKPGGSLLLESHDLSTHDADWDAKVSTVREVGFEVTKTGSLCDDGLLARQHVLLTRRTA